MVDCETLLPPRSLTMVLRCPEVALGFCPRAMSISLLQGKHRVRRRRDGVELY